MVTGGRRGGRVNRVVPVLRLTPAETHWERRSDMRPPKRRERQANGPGRIRTSDLTVISGALRATELQAQERPLGRPIQAGPVRAWPIRSVTARVSAQVDRGQGVGFYIWGFFLERVVTECRRMGLNGQLTPEINPTGGTHEIDRSIATSRLQNVRGGRFACSTYVGGQRSRLLEIGDHQSCPARVLGRFPADQRCAPPRRMPLRRSPQGCAPCHRIGNSRFRVLGSAIHDTAISRGLQRKDELDSTVEIAPGDFDE